MRYTKNRKIGFTLDERDKYKEKKYNMSYSKLDKRKKEQRRNSEWNLDSFQHLYAAMYRIHYSNKKEILSSGFGCNFILYFQKEKRLS